MKLKISDGAASSLGMLAIAIRILFGVTIEMPNLYNSGWISVLLGGAMAMPLAFAAGQIRARASLSPFALLTESSPAVTRVFAALLAAIAVWDAAISSDAISCSASYVALGSVSMLYLLLPQLLLCYWCLKCNGDAIGFSAGIWNRVLPWLLLIIVVIEIKQFRFQWITPALGPGIPSLIEGAVRVAGWLSLLTGTFLIAEKDGEKSLLNPVRLTGRCCLIAALLVLLHGLMTPPLVYTEKQSRFFLLDTLLSNGRSTLSLQLPLMILWFIGLFLLLLFDVFFAAAMLQTALPKLKKRPCVLLVLAAITALSIFNLTSGDLPNLTARWLYALHGAILLLSMAMMHRAKGGARHA